MFHFRCTPVIYLLGVMVRGIPNELVKNSCVGILHIFTHIPTQPLFSRYLNSQTLGCKPLICWDQLVLGCNFSRWTCSAAWICKDSKKHGQSVPQSFICSCKIDSPALLNHHSTTLELAVHLHLLHLLITKVREAAVNGQAILLRV